MTKSTIATLRIVNTLATRAESLVPSTSSAVKMATMTKAPQLTCRPKTEMVAGTSQFASSKTLLR